LVITLADPQTVLAYDRHTGKLRWHQSMDQLDLLFPGDEGKAAEVRKLWTVVDTLFFKYNLSPEEKVRRGKLEEVNARRRELFEESLDMTWDEAMALLKKHGIDPPKGNDLHGPKGLPKAMKKKFRSWGLWQRGYSTMGHTEATPVSDGKWLWASFVSNTVTCYDIKSGKVRWSRFFGDKTKVSEQLMPNWKQRKRWPVSKFYPSPLLIGDVLVVQHGHAMRGLDPETGKTLWEFPYIKTYYGTGTPVRMRLGDTDVIVTARGWVVRVKDGHVLTKGWDKRVTDRQLGGSSPFTNGADIIVFSDSGTGGGHGRQEVTGWRLGLDGDKLTHEHLWTVKKAANEGSGLCYKGWVYENGFARKKRRINVKTGKVDGIPTGYLNRYGGKYGSVHIAGNQLLDWDGFDTFSVFRLSDGGETIKPLETAKLHFETFYGDFKGRREPLDKEFEKRRIAKRLEAWENGVIGWFDASTTGGGQAYGHNVWFKGDRIYLRTRWELYCFGPPEPKATESEK
jgi:hypothetical protein